MEEYEKSPDCATPATVNTNDPWLRRDVLAQLLNMRPTDPIDTILADADKILKWINGGDSK